MNVNLTWNTGDSALETWRLSTVLDTGHWTMDIDHRTDDNGKWTFGQSAVDWTLGDRTRERSDSERVGLFCWSGCAGHSIMV